MSIMHHGLALIGSAYSEIGIHHFWGGIAKLAIWGDVLEIRVKLSRHGLIDAVFAKALRVRQPASRV